MSQGITVLVIYTSKLPRGSYPLIPAEEYRLCFDCDADVRLVNKACEAHPVARAAGRWASAVVVFDNGEIHKIKNPSSPVLQA